MLNKGMCVCVCVCVCVAQTTLKTIREAPFIGLFEDLKVSKTYNCQMQFKRASMNDADVFPLCTRGLSALRDAAAAGM